MQINLYHKPVDELGQNDERIAKYYHVTTFTIEQNGTLSFEHQPPGKTHREKITTNLPFKIIEDFDGTLR